MVIEETSDKITEVVEVLDVRTAVLSNEIAKNIRDSILEGRVDPAKAGIALKKMAKVSETLLKDKLISDVIFQSTEKYMAGTKSCTLFGAKIIKAATYTYYDFKVCGHPVLDALYSIQEEIKERIKLLEEELKLMVKTNNKDITPNDGQQELGIKDNSKDIIVPEVPKLVWENSGEVANVQPPIKKQTIGLKYMEV